MDTNDKETSFENLIIEMMPFADQLKKWCKDHPEFLFALKNINPKKFISLGAIVTSYPKNSRDEVIGIYLYDYISKTPKFKQDFIVNVNKEYKEFILYTRNPGGSSKYVKDINDFYNKYGKDGSYKNSHHLTLDQLPQEIKFRGEEAIRLANKIKKLGGFQKPLPEMVERINREVSQINKEDRYTKIKLKTED